MPERQRASLPPHRALTEVCPASICALQQRDALIRGGNVAHGLWWGIGGMLSRALAGSTGRREDPSIDGKATAGSESQHIPSGLLPEAVVADAAGGAAGASVASPVQAITTEWCRSAIRAAQRTRDPAAEAKARMSLGDLERAAGDLTSACEHWQLARALFERSGDGPGADAAAGRMRSCDCPTDWVLNDF